MAGARQPDRRYLSSVTPDDHLAGLRRELYAFAGTLHEPLSTPVAHCGDWTLYDLADHLGRGNLWAAAAVARRRGDHRTPAAPREPAALRVWFAASAVILLTVLDADPATPAWSFAAAGTVGFWRRRRCAETLVHRWDAECAVGAPGDIDPCLADDAVAEVIEVMAPRQIERGRARPPRCAIRLTTTDTLTSRVYGPGAPVATVTGSAADLMLLLWGRRTLEQPGLTCAGDAEALRAVLAGPLVP
jgi:uncharacterized protein (TIGR03083 family)